MELSEVSSHSEVAHILKGKSRHLDPVEIKHKAGMQLEHFSRLVRKQLADRFIDIPPALSLVDCPNCSMTLGSSHPQEEEIIAWLDGNLAVHQAFKEVELIYEMVSMLENGNHYHDGISFHIGLTSAGNVAYFESQQCCNAQ